MKKNLLIVAAFFTGALTYAQCDAVASLNEDFSEFTLTTQNAFPQNCWNASGAAAQGPWIYTAEDGEPANQYAVYYTHMAGANVAGYIISPELSTIDGNHELSFDTYKLGQGGNIPEGNITVEVGTLSDLTDLNTFESVAAPFTVTETSETHANIVIEASSVQKYVVFKFIADAMFNAAALDNVVWSEVANTCVAVETLDENFNSFTTSQTTIDQNCWSASTGVPLVYVDGEEEDNNVTFYAANAINTAGYLVSPELSTVDGNHELSFDVYKIGSPAPVTTIQAGTLASATDFESFQPVGDIITTTSETISISNIVIDASETQKFIAFKFVTDNAHGAAGIDNIKWTAVTAGLNDLNKSAFSIYPNPSSNKNITINHNPEAKGTINIFTLTGAKVFTGELNNSGSQNFNLDTLSPGMYIVKIESGNYSESKKLIIQ